MPFLNLILIVASLITAICLEPIGGLDVDNSTSIDYADEGSGDNGSGSGDGDWLQPIGPTGSSDLVSDSPNDYASEGSGDDKGSGSGDGDWLPTKGPIGGSDYDDSSYSDEDSADEGNGGGFIEINPNETTIQCYQCVIGPVAYYIINKKRILDDPKCRGSVIECTTSCYVTRKIQKLFGRALSVFHLGCMSEDEIENCPTTAEMCRIKEILFGEDSSRIELAGSGGSTRLELQSPTRAPDQGSWGDEAKSTDPSREDDNTLPPTRSDDKTRPPLRGSDKTVPPTWSFSKAQPSPDGWQKTLPTTWAYEETKRPTRSYDKTEPPILDELQPSTLAPHQDSGGDESKSTGPSRKLGIDTTMPPLRDYDETLPTTRVYEETKRLTGSRDKTQSPIRDDDDQTPTGPSQDLGLLGDVRAEDSRPVEKDDGLGDLLTCCPASLCNEELLFVDLVCYKEISCYVSYEEVEVDNTLDVPDSADNSFASWLCAYSIYDYDFCESSSMEATPTPAEQVITTTSAPTLMACRGTCYMRDEKDVQIERGCIPYPDDCFGHPPKEDHYSFFVTDEVRGICCTTINRDGTPCNSPADYLAPSDDGNSDIQNNLNVGVNIPILGPDQSTPTERPGNVAHPGGGGGINSGSSDASNTLLSSVAFCILFMQIVRLIN